MCQSIARILSIAITLLLLTSIALATEPAVSAINGKAATTFGSVDSDNFFFTDGSIAFPLNNATGLQFDAGFGNWDSDLPDDIDITRYGLHLFARNPQLGLAGIYASANELSFGSIDYDVNQYAIEGEVYSGPLTFTTLLGQNSGDADDELMGLLDVRWYPMDELMVEIGAAIVDSDKKAHLGAEYQLLKSLASFTDLALSAYADLAVGDDSYDHALLGLRAYFGKPKPLIKRHREDAVGNTTDRLNPPLVQ